MANTLTVVLALWFCVQPQLVSAQTGETEVSKPSANGERTVSSQPEIQPSGNTDSVEADRQIVQIGGTFYLKPMEIVESLVLIGGNSTIRGQVQGNILVLKGNVEVLKGAEVLGSITTIFGKINGKEHLEKGLHREINGWRLVPASASLIMRPQLAWGIEKSEKFGWAVLAFIGLTLIHVLIFAIFPQQMDTMAGVISHRPVGSTLIGLVVLIVIPSLTAVLVLSIIGIPLVLLLFSILMPMAIYGKTAIFLSMGNTIFSHQPRIVSVVAGYWIYFMATSIPRVDLVTFLVANTIGVGVCIRTMFGQKSGPRLSPFTRSQPFLDNRQ